MTDNNMLKNITQTDLIDLVKLALFRLQSFFIPSKRLFYSELVLNDTINFKFNVNQSIRYSLISAIGLHKATKVGYLIDFSLNEVFQSIINQIESNNRIKISLGDYGFILWLDALLGMKRGNEIINFLKAKLTNRVLSSLEGDKLAWLICGLCEELVTESIEMKEQYKILNKIADFHLSKNWNASTGLFYHHAKRSSRRRYSSFATQSYSIYAFAKLFKYFKEEKFLISALSCADKICQLQNNYGGWPWMFDVQNGNVVENYEIYSVHQYGMAPMALFELSDISGKSYLKQIIKGIKWIYGNNELGISILDWDTKLIYRSLKRCFPYDKVYLFGNTLLSKIDNEKKILEFDSRNIKINKTCRAYELGWLLEAFSERTDLFK